MMDTEAVELGDCAWTPIVNANAANSAEPTLAAVKPSFLFPCLLRFAIMIYPKFDVRQLALPAVSECRRDY